MPGGKVGSAGTAASTRRTDTGCPWHQDEHRARAGAPAAAGPPGPGMGGTRWWPSLAVWPGWSRQPASCGHWPGVPGHCTAPASSPGTGSCGIPGAETPRWQPLPQGSSTAPHWHKRGSHPRTWGDGQELGAPLVAGHHLGDQLMMLGHHSQQLSWGWRHSLADGVQLLHILSILILLALHALNHAVTQADEAAGKALVDGVAHPGLAQGLLAHGCGREEDGAEALHIPPSHHLLWVSLGSSDTVLRVTIAPAPEPVREQCNDPTSDAAICHRGRMAASCFAPASLKPSVPAQIPHQRRLICDYSREKKQGSASWSPCLHLGGREGGRGRIKRRGRSGGTEPEKEKDKGKKKKGSFFCFNLRTLNSLLCSTKDSPLGLDKPQCQQPGNACECTRS